MEPTVLRNVGLGTWVKLGISVLSSVPISLARDIGAYVAHSCIKSIDKTPPMVPMLVTRVSVMLEVPTLLRW